jgi:hypothetical protein
MPAISVTVPWRFVLVIAADCGMGARNRRQIGSRRADRLDAGFLVIRDDGELARVRAATGGPPHLDLPVDAQNLRHFRLELGIAPLQVVADPRLREGRLLCGLISRAASILQTVP